MKPASKSYNQGGFVMDDRPSVPIPTSTYDEFLFAPVCEEASGMRLSVLSALTRMDIDPWKEATRLAAMPKTIAESTLVATLELIPNRCWEPSEAKVIAVRLVRLLPQHSDETPIAAKKVAAVRAQRAGYWLVWMGLATALTLLVQHHQAATTGAGDDTSTSIAASPTQNIGANTVTPGVSGQPD